MSQLKCPWANRVPAVVMPPVRANCAACPYNDELAAASSFSAVDISALVSPARRADVDSRLSPPESNPMSPPMAPPLTAEIANCWTSMSSLRPCAICRIWTPRSMPSTIPANSAMLRRHCLAICATVMRASRTRGGMSARLAPPLASAAPSRYASCAISSHTVTSIMYLAYWICTPTPLSATAVFTSFLTRAAT
ncbi:hypothetical protein [Nonomuraea sp. B1E8]|uniref:hypothetical protein n=1 Tax=unclassified Nonomuraea TaxID=2593643 RepID=UPI00325E8286